MHRITTQGSGCPQALHTCVDVSRHRLGHSLCSAWDVPTSTALKEYSVNSVRPGESAHRPRCPSFGPEAQTSFNHSGGLPLSLGFTRANSSTCGRSFYRYRQLISNPLARKASNWNLICRSRTGEWRLFAQLRTTSTPFRRFRTDGSNGVKDMISKHSLPCRADGYCDRRSTSADACPLLDELD